MEKNCLVTRLRAVVDDDSLEILDDGTIRCTWLSITQSSNSVLWFGAYSEFEVRLTTHKINGLNQSPNGTIEGDNVYKTTGEDNKYAGVILNESLPNYTHVPLVAVKGIDNIRYVSSCDLSPDLVSNTATNLLLYQYKDFGNPFTLEDLNLTAKTNLEVINLNGSLKACNLSGLNSIVNKNKVQNIIVNNNSLLTGDISVLGNFTSLTVVDFSNTGIDGKIEDMIRNFVTNSKTSGSLNISYGTGSQVTFNNATLTGNFGKTVTWSKSGSTVTINLTNTQTSAIIDTVTITV